jgi:uncharacterized protein (TIGR02271 family)
MDRTRKEMDNHQESHLPVPPTELHLQTAEEQIVVGKRQEEAGRVHLNKVVHTEHVEQAVELAHENVQVERVPVGQDAVAPDAFQERAIEMPLMSEEAVVSKGVRATEEVAIQKHATSERRTVQGQVRSSDVEIDDSEVDEYVITPEERAAGRR